MEENDQAISAVLGYNRPLNWCQALWMHCLVDAIEQWRAGSIDDYQWLFIDHKNHVGSFNWVCDCLGIDAERFRQLLVSKRRGLVFFGRSVAKIVKEF